MEQTKTITKENAAENREQVLRKTREITFAVDVYTDTDNIYLEGNIPGVDENSLDITFEKNILTIVGKNPAAEANAQDNTLKLKYAEFRNADYRRSFQFNENIDADNIEAVVKNGVLRLKVPVKKPEVKKINVKAN